MVSTKCATIFRPQVRQNTKNVWCTLQALVLSRGVKSKRTSQAKFKNFSLGYHTTILVLPNEILLTICEFLDPEFRLLFSLSCRRIWVLINPNSNAVISKLQLDVRLSFMRYLELDYPGYLACRKCGFLFHWLSREQSGYRCPCAYHEDESDYLYSCTSWPIRFWSDATPPMRHEIIDLLLRANERGVEYGLPLSVFNKETVQNQGHLSRIKARIVAGELHIAYVAEINLQLVPNIPAINYTNLVKCDHGDVALSDKLWPPPDEIIHKVVELEQSMVIKCPFCASDYKFYIQNNNASKRNGGNERNKKILIMDARFNFGHRYDRTLASKQILHLAPCSQKIDAETVSQRNLHALF